MDPVHLSLIVAFGAGALSFASPCVLPLVPAYIGHLAGRSVGKEPDAGQRSETLAHALAFVLGFSAVFIVLGASVGLVGFIVREQLPWLRWVGGAILVVMGLHVAGVLRIPALYRELRLPFRPSRRLGMASSFPGRQHLWRWVDSVYRADSRRYPTLRLDHADSRAGRAAADRLLAGTRRAVPDRRAGARPRAGFLAPPQSAGEVGGVDQRRFTRRDGICRDVQPDWASRVPFPYVDCLGASPRS